MVPVDQVFYQESGHLVILQDTQMHTHLTIGAYFAKKIRPDVIPRSIRRLANHSRSIKLSVTDRAALSGPMIISKL